MKKRYYQEYESIEDLLKQSEHYIYCVKYKNEYIYYVGQITFPDISILSFYRSKEKYSGWVSLDENGKLKVGKIPKVNYIPIIELKYSNFVEEMLIGYNKKKQ